MKESTVTTEGWLFAALAFFVWAVLFPAVMYPIGMVFGYALQIAIGHPGPLTPPPLF